MRIRASIAWAAALAVLPSVAGAQVPGYPITVIAPGQESYTFPPGYQTPWDRIEIRVTEKMSRISIRSLGSASGSSRSRPGSTPSGS
jgi:hypothetical protein